MNPTICVAGKNSIAVNGLDCCLEALGPEPIDRETVMFLPHRLDEGVDQWQPSFRRHAQRRNVRQTTLDELYEIDDLIFISLEYADLIDPGRFRSDELFNIHFSLLPKYKGMFTSAQPLLFGETSTGVTLHKIDAGIDTGDIVDQIQFDIDIADTARDVYFKYLRHSSELVRRNIGSVLAKRYKQHPQSAYGSSYFSRKSIDYANIRIDLRKSAAEVHNQFRAFMFREYQMPSFNDWQIVRSQITSSRSVGRPGRIVREQDDCFVVSTIDYDIRLTKDYYPLLWEASETNDLKEIDRALRFVEDIDLRNKQGWSALIIAAYHGNLEAVCALISAGADPNSKNHKGTTALMYSFAAYERTKDSRVFMFLLEHGADHRCEDCFGKSLSDYMRERNCTDLLPLLRI